MDLKEEDILGDDIASHWYYAAKSRALMRYVSQLHPIRILDVGAGSGFFSKELLRNTDAREALCIDTSYPEESETTIAGKPLRFKKQCGVLEADLVLMMDVLEHVDDDVGLLRSYVQHAPIGGHFLITVPAFAFLWSSHDVFLEHKRRYSLPQLEAVAAAAGLTVLESAYYFGLVFPIAAAMRLAEKGRRTRQIAPRSQLRRHNLLTNHTLYALCCAELPFARWNKFAGLSIFCLAAKSVSRPNAPR